MDGFLILAIAGTVGLAIGYFCGRWPYDAAKERGQDTLGLVALGVCTLCGLFGGCLLSLPLAWVFRLAVMAAGEAPSGDRAGYSGLAESDYARLRARQREAGEDEPPPGRYQLIGPLVVCNDCGHAGSKDEGGNVPPDCPKCGLRFRPGKRAKARRAGPEEVVDLTADPRKDTGAARLAAPTPSPSPQPESCRPAGCRRPGERPRR